MPPLIQYFWGEITQPSCDGEQFHREIEVLGNARSSNTHARHVSGEKVQGTYTPKWAIAISDDGSLVRSTENNVLPFVHMSCVRYEDLAED